MGKRRSIDISTAVYAKIWSLHRQGEECEDEILARVLGVSSLPKEPSPERNLKIRRLWRHDIRSALENLGGEAGLEAIYEETRKIRLRAERSLPLNFKAIVRKELEYNSSDSEAYKGKFDWFRSVDGIGRGRWALCKKDEIK